MDRKEVGDGTPAQLAEDDEGPKEKLKGTLADALNQEGFLLLVLRLRQLNITPQAPSSKSEAKPLGWRAMPPCATSPHPETNRLEAKQLRLRLSKSGLRYQDNSQKSKISFGTYPAVSATKTKAQKRRY